MDSSTDTSGSTIARRARSAETPSRTINSILHASLYEGVAEIEDRAGASLKVICTSMSRGEQSVVRIGQFIQVGFSCSELRPVDPLQRGNPRSAVSASPLLRDERRLSTAPVANLSTSVPEASHRRAPNLPPPHTLPPVRP